MSKRKSSSDTLKMYSNIVNGLAKDITKNEKVIQGLKTKVSVNSKFIDRLSKKNMFSMESRTLKNTYKNTIKKDKEIINDLSKKNERLRKSQEKYITELKNYKKNSKRNSYSTISSNRSSKDSINSIINKYTNRSSDKQLDSLLDEVELLLKMKMKSK